MTVKTSLGICIGASSIKAVALRQEGSELSVVSKKKINHESNPAHYFQELLQGMDLSAYDYVLLTGRKFKDIINSRSLTELEAIEAALEYTTRVHADTSRYNVVVSLGAENFIMYPLDGQNHITTVETGNKCASGTGEFFLQQIRRMDVSPDEAVALASGSEIAHVSGRCSVFCKSDCTHALNKGIPIGRVAAGLCKMMAEKVLELLEKIETQHVIAVGGVTNNKLVMKFLSEKVDSLYVPEDANYFEALGAAYYALKHGVDSTLDMNALFKDSKSSFATLPVLEEGRRLVEFKDAHRAKAQDGDECIIGLDVGSTTTKAVLLRISDNAVLASIYLRTNGSPVQASRACYREIKKQVVSSVKIVGLATTGSGRKIAGLHAKTDVIINEIIAHATGAAYYDEEVDTIFEIGGQDAKYTYLTNAVPSDYAMNEACSAGTGSFLEESAQESLQINYTDIQDIALQSKSPANFNDQCAAFINSDIKTATHERIAREDIVAGLVYSICMNYVNRVKGQRQVGNKIFMQGGVCYNKAVPMAMANLIGKKIIVPPDPGLIGAFGVALELKNRIEGGLAQRQEFFLDDLINREIEYGKSFTCKGSKEKCDRGCEINILIIDGIKMPFGGACDKYYNQVHKISADIGGLDFVHQHQDIIFGRYQLPQPGHKKTIGICRSYLTYILFPLYNHYFQELGLDVVLSDGVDPDGLRMKRTSFCYPGELAHGVYANILRKNLDYIFLPKVMGFHVENSINRTKEHQSTCVLLQSEAYYLKSAFKNWETKSRVLSPVLDFTFGYESQEKAFVSLAEELGFTKNQGKNAYRFAMTKHNETMRSLKALGRKVLDELEAAPNSFAVVLFGRFYNAFAKDANMGIPSKFASRGITIIPWDILPFENEACDKDMCWAIGQNLLKAAAYVKKHPQLFAAYVTNFSCGPDSFLIGYFRDIMRTKPSLTLELDSHTADAGINTRVEAYIDIVKRNIDLKKQEGVASEFRAAYTEVDKKTPYFITSDNERVSFFDKRVHVLIPSMGKISSEFLAATFEGIGVRASALPVYDHKALHYGHCNASCKECLPLLLTCGGLLKYLDEREDENELLAYFMPFTPGNCRFPQYRVFLRTTIERKRIKNVAVFSLVDAEKGYSVRVFSAVDRINVLKGFIIADVLEDIKNALSVLAIDKVSAMQIFQNETDRILKMFRTKQLKTIYEELAYTAQTLSQLKLKYPLKDAAKVSIMGEIFVRRDYFSVQDLLERLAEKNIVVKKSHFFEWLKYVDYLVKYGIYQANFGFRDWMQFNAKFYIQSGIERKIKKALARSGLIEYETIDIPSILEYGQKFFDIKFRGESILATGSYFKEILHNVHGVISIGPFACMPTRVIESVLSVESTYEVKNRIDNEIHGATGGKKKQNGHGRHAGKLQNIPNLPFLSIESDGNPFPQVVGAKIESFCIQVERLHDKVRQLEK